MTRTPLGVAVAGFGWMGRVHTQAYARVLHHFPQLPLAPQLVAVADEVPGRAEEAAAQFGFAAADPDWRELAADPRVAGRQHRRAELPAPRDRRGDGRGRQAHLDREAGRPHRGRRRGPSPTRSRRPASRARSASTTATRPAVAAAREMIAARRARHDHARPVPAVQRLRRAPRGRAELALRAGARRQRGARRPGLARRRPGPVPARRHRHRWSPTPRSSCPSGPGPPARPAGHTRASRRRDWGRWRTRTTSRSLLRFASGARGVLEASRVSVGEQNNYGFEIHGTKGAVFWDFRRMGELGVSVGTAYQDQPVSTVFVGPGARRVRRLPAGLGEQHGLRRPQGDRGLPASCGRSRRARRTARPSTTPCAARRRWTRWPESAATGGWVPVRA